VVSLLFSGDGENMSKTLARYSPEDVTVILAGFYTVSGFSAGTFVSINKYSPVFTERQSADGHVSRTHTKSDLYKVNISLASTSDSNQVLTYMSRLDELTFRAKFPVIIKDQLGSSLFFASQCWIESVPSADYSEDVDTREWAICCYGGAFNVGGNYEPSSEMEDILNIGSGIIGGVV